MIARLSGSIAARAADHVVVDVAGVGFHVFVSTSTLAQLPECGELAVLHVHTLVREDAIQLHGFSTTVERELFRTLLKLSGIGPKNAMHILSGMPLAELIRAIAGGDVERLTRLPGVGRKTAERLVLELRERVAAFGGEVGDGAAATVPIGAGHAHETLEALVRLGMPRVRAERAVRELAQRLASDTPIQQWIREALREVGAS